MDDYPRCATCRHWLPVEPPVRYWWHTDEQWAAEMTGFAAKPPAAWRYCGYFNLDGGLVRVDDPAEAVQTHATFGCAAHERPETEGAA
jgi:hypothetical protein